MLSRYWRKEQRDFFFWQPLMAKDDGHHVLHDIPLVGEYEDVFEALKGSLPAGGDVLTIELESGTTPVSRFSIPISGSRDDRWKENMEDSSDMGFIRPSTSPWGASLFL